MGWETVRKVALARDGGKCLKCLGVSTVVHHRKIKGMGGTSDPEVATGLANLVSLCAWCHQDVHLHPEESYRTGYLVHSWDDPADIPLIVKPSAFYIHLTEDGDMRQVWPVSLF